MNFKGSILIVDDEPHIRKFVALIVRTLGITAVTEAADGEDAIARFAADHPDVVLLDVNMPRIDGLETLRRIKEVDPDAVVIMLTSLANRASVDRALDLGAANYIRKDTPKEEIIRSLAETIDAAFGPGDNQT
ncbi:MAG TPA: response regulator transcription factor [Opitutaceae bacterium]|nr:response regulator transcription factor [Opitutaceae bacterium]